MIKTINTALGTTQNSWKFHRVCYATVQMTLYSLQYIFTVTVVVIAYTGLCQRCLVWPEAEMSRMAGDGDVSYGRRRRCLVWPGTEMSCMAGDGEVLYGQGRRSHVWLETVMSRMAGDDC